MPAGSLGCGEAGEPQNAGLIIGTEIVLSAADREYVYHSDGARLVPCTPIDFPGGRRRPSSPATPAKPAPTIQGAAVADLARIGHRT